MDRDESFGRLLRRRRKARDLTQDALAQQVYCSADTIKKLEQGRRRPSRQLAAQLADFLGLARDERVAFLAAARADAEVNLPDEVAPPIEQPGADRASTAAPSGTVTFLFTDIAGSTAMWEQHPDAMHIALARHDTLLRQAVERYDGHVFKTVGDSFYVAFRTPADALAAALAAQHALQLEQWSTSAPLRVRMALHAGMVELRDGDYFGPPLNRLARLLGLAHGGQILLSRTVMELVYDRLSPDMQLRDLGMHRLKDLAQPEHIFQLIAPGVLTVFPPLKTLDTRLSSLPAQPTPFIGREKERMLVRVLLRRADVRLLTLCGPGGTGKTRLALQVAVELLDDFPDGVVVVTLASISDPALVMPTIAKALGVMEAGDQPLVALLSDALRDQHLLLLLDNFEQVLPAAEEIAALLAATHGLKMIVTSRAALHLSWEREFAVPPLAAPDRALLPSLDQITRYDAVMLFVARAQAVNADFALTEENVAAVAEICRRLDGLPLAIELATARSKLFTPQTLLARLDRRLALLTGGSQDLPVRQRTLRSTIDWSYNLLEPWEQTLFARLAVFAGGCTVEMAEAVCSGIGDTATAVLDGLQSLVDKTLLQQTQGYTSESRFVMLETIHEYALELLMAGGEAPAMQRKHAEVFLALAEMAESELEGADQGAWLSQLQQEHDNLRAALDWVVEHGDADTGLRFARALRLFWFMRGHLTEGRRRLAQILKLMGGSAAARAKALDSAGFLARYQGDYAAAAAIINESLTIWRTLGDNQGIADALSNLGYVTLHQGDYVAARVMYEESLDLNRSLRNEQGYADCLSHLGSAAFYQGDTGTAQALHEESLAIWRRLGDVEGATYALYNLGDVLFAQGDYAAAALRFKESLTASVELGWPWGIVCAVEGVAGLAAYYERNEVAIQLAGFAARLRKNIAIPLSLARQAVLARWLAPARQALSGAAHVAALEAGEALTLEQAVDRAFAELALGADTVTRVQPHAPIHPLQVDYGGLTVREREVAALIAEGRSNRTIAAALVVGVKTVEAHTSRILTKLGFSSRAQIAAWVVAKGLASARPDLERER